MAIRRAVVLPTLMLVIVASMIGAASPAFADGGDFALDFIAAGPNSYDHETGTGGEYGDRTIDKQHVVESLEGGDFACGDLVVYFLAIEVDPAATGEQDAEFRFGFLAEPTGQPGVGHIEPVVASANTGDSANAGDTGDTDVELVSQETDTDAPPPNDTVFAVVRVSNLDPGETFILRLTVPLGCAHGARPTGNLQAELLEADVVSPVEEAISSGSGNQTIPFKKIEDIIQPASVSIDVGACPEPGSPTVPVTVTIEPEGAATVTIVGEGGPYVVIGGGDVLDLAPGVYDWSAEPEPGFELTGRASGEFTVQDCPAILASVVVTVDACPPTSSATRPTTVTINPDGAASVTVTGPDGFIQVVEGSGATLDLAPGDYTWTATANPTYEILGAAEGTFTVGSCIIEVKPRGFLPKTGSGGDVSGLAGAGVAMVLLGVGMVALSRRREPVTVRSGGWSDQAWAMYFAQVWLTPRVIPRRIIRRLH